MAQQEYIVEIVEQFNRDGRIVCPECGPSRKKKHERTMSITVTDKETFYYCHHCGEAGRIERKPFYEQYLAAPKKAEVRQIPTQLNDSVNKLTAWFERRSINITDLSGMPPMITGRKWYRKLDTEVDSIGFVYGNIENPEAIKWRPLDGTKAMTQDGSARSFYNLAALPEAPEEIIIVEGEPDVVAMASIGVVAISVPNGAPNQPLKNQRMTPEQDNKFAYLWDARGVIEAAQRIILAVDGDEQGGYLSDELARRIGRAKCWRVQWPDNGDKDPTDVISHSGGDAMLQLLKDAEPMPLHGVYAAKDYNKEFEELYFKGHGSGISTGMESVDKLFTLAETSLTVVTGLPNSGKSEFIDQLMVNTALSHDWRWAVASFENPPPEHMAKLSEKIVGKPFYEGVTPRMKKSEAEDAAAFIDSHFVFLDSKDGAVPTPESIIDRTKQAVMRLGVNGLIIDPYNYIEMDGEKEHKGISDMLTKIVTFAKAHGIHVFFIAHPKGMVPLKDGTFPVPTGMHISGGPTWFAKADLGLTVHRGAMGVEIHCWKSRVKWVGKQGMVYVDYDVPTGRYRDYPGGQPIDISKKMGRSDDYGDLDF